MAKIFKNKSMQRKVVIKESEMRCVVVESPYAGNIKESLEYVRQCMADCLKRGEAPFASHALYTQDGMLDDSVPEERKLGMEAGFEIGRRMDATIVYTDLGVSGGMKAGINRAVLDKRPVEWRSLTPIGKWENYQLNKEKLR